MSTEGIEGADGDTLPPPRYGHVCYAFANTLVIAGGRGVNGQLLADTWTVNIDVDGLIREHGDET